METAFIDTNILFRMFAISKKRHERYLKEGTTGLKSLDYSLKLLEACERGEIRIVVNDLAVMESCGIPARNGLAAKARSMAEAIMHQEGIDIYTIPAILYPTAFSSVLNYGFQVRDAIHVASSIILGADKLITSDLDMANKTNQIVKKAKQAGLILDNVVCAGYQISQGERRELEELLSANCARIQVEKAPSEP